MCAILKYGTAQLLDLQCGHKHNHKTTQLKPTLHLVYLESSIATYS